MGEPSVSSGNVMLTRFKLSQQMRQLREKDRKITEIPRISTTDKASKTSPKGKSHEKSPGKTKKEKLQSNSNKLEHVPSKAKRNIVPKEILLKPRHELKIVAGDNKRKSNTPQKDTKSSPPKRNRNKSKPPVSSRYSSPKVKREDDKSQSPIYSELSFEEMIRMIDEKHCLDDEDLLEILTCPSPVWWEEPPDEHYTEDAIFICSPEEDNQLSSRTKRSRKTLRPRKTENTDEVLSNKNESDEISDKQYTDITAGWKINNKCDEKFNKKRSKLEKLLDGIKDNLVKPKVTYIYDKINFGKNCQNKDETNDNELNVETSPEKCKNLNNPPFETRINRISESTEDEDQSPVDTFHDNSILRDLENIDIPMESDKTKAQNCSLTVSAIKVDNSSDFDSTYIRNTMNKNNNKGNNFEITDENGVPINLPPLKRCPKLENKLISSHYPSRSLETIEPVSRMSNQNNLETIYHTNVQFFNNDDASNEVCFRNNFEVKNGTLKTNRVDVLLENTNHLNDGNNASPVFEIRDLSENISKKYDDEKKSSLDTAKGEIKETEQVVTLQQDTEQYVTVYRIVSSNDLSGIPTKSNYETKKKLSHDNDGIKEVSDSALVNKELENLENNKYTLDYYYTSCKNVRTRVKDISKDKDNEIVKDDICNKREENLVGNNPNEDSETGIMVLDSEKVKYCGKCSSIFDQENCSNCVSKEKRLENSDHQGCLETYKESRSCNIV